MHDRRASRPPSSTAGRPTRPSLPRPPDRGHSRRRQALTFGLFAVAILVVWEVVKWLGGVLWRFENVFGSGQDFFHDPPFAGRSPTTWNSRTGS